MAHHDLIFKHATIVNQDGVHAADIGVRAGRIAALGELAADSAAETVDCTGLHILPGVIDTQVHFREPGLEHRLPQLLVGQARAAVERGVERCKRTSPYARRWHW